MNTYDTDVLVVGSGLAGLTAAISAKEQRPDLKVMLCSKSPPGRANCTAVSKGAFRNPSTDYSPEECARETLESGYYLNDQKLLETLVNKSEKELDLLGNYGVKLEKRKRGRYVYRKSLSSEGTVISRALLEQVTAKGIKIVHPFFAWDLIKSNGQAAGVWGFFVNKPEPVALFAGATVLATGGAGAVYSRTDNPPGVTGDGYTLAYRAGLPLMDMEFVQFYPLGSAFPGSKARFLLPILAEAGRFINAEEEDIVKKYKIDKHPLASNSRDELSRAMALEVAENRGVDGAIKLEFDFSPDTWRRAQNTFGYTDVEPVKKWLEDYLGSRKYIPVMPIAHFCCGGIIIDKHCQTDIQGLFAAGEVTGGLHGADRLGGNALSEALVFGKIAGKNAADFSVEQESKTNKSFNPKTLEKNIFHEAEKLLARSSKYEKPNKQDFRKMKKHLAVEMMDDVGLIRSEASLQQANQTITEGLNNLAWNKRKEHLRSFLELNNLYQTASLISRAAKVRKESRGTHYRTDYPELSERWDKNIIVSRWLK